MTRRGLREHCFKMLFCAELYPAEEAEEQHSASQEQKMGEAEDEAD